MEEDCCRICLSKTQTPGRQDLFLEDSESCLSLIGLLYEEVLSLPIVNNGGLTFRYICSSCDLQLKLFKQLKNKALETYLFLNDISTDILVKNESLEDIDDNSIETSIKLLDNQVDALTNNNFNEEHFLETNDNEENISQLTQCQDDQLENNFSESTTTENFIEAVENDGLQAVQDETNTSIYEYEQLIEDEQKDEDDFLSIEELLPENAENAELSINTGEEDFEVNYLDLSLNESVDKVLENFENAVNQKLYEREFGKTVDEHIGLDTHSSDVNEVYPCVDCNATFKLKSQLQNHRKKLHPPTIKIKCPECSSILFSEDTFKAHMNLHNGLPAYQCEICGKSFNQKVHYTYHTLNHNNERNIICEICKKAFISKGDLKTHMRAHTNERRYKCNICDKTFRESTHMVNHRYSHFEKQFECPECFQKYVSPNTLRTHYKAVHRGEVPFACTYCEKRFKRKHHLKAHYKTHSKMKDLLEVSEE